ncbi:MAG: VOC family protein [Rhodobacteraceae bacterium]|nr:VOC family protein [Paracoccaceae bacterium]
MAFTPYLTFDGNCKEAFEWYAEVLGGSIVAMMRFRDEPSCAGMPEEVQDKIMHARLQFRDSLLMASDLPMGEYVQPQSVHVAIDFGDTATAKAVFGQFADGGEVSMPFDKTFWTEGFGIVRDRFGVLWMVNVANPDSPYY